MSKSCIGRCPYDAKYRNFYELATGEIIMRGEDRKLSWDNDKKHHDAIFHNLITNVEDIMTKVPPCAFENFIRDLTNIYATYHGMKRLGQDIEPFKSFEWINDDRNDIYLYCESNK